MQLKIYCLFLFVAIDVDEIIQIEFMVYVLFRIKLKIVQKILKINKSIFMDSVPSSSHHL